MLASTLFFISRVFLAAGNPNKQALIHWIPRLVSGVLPFRNILVHRLVLPRFYSTAVGFGVDDSCSVCVWKCCQLALKKGTASLLHMSSGTKFPLFLRS